ncbi:hypothetical protein AURDEDRAFT_177970 [Auricularia subglabra TFB-10046 SS5]|uniref:Uncharacterized protein n=1 Tax=Auricularia subglabra (strain TFB-10046 / SS5) TaxID=717982 RepID=J0L9B9_AURST|nr:hypothetical protein AURDEDRAFT_177970 [Auricularia subglabra TFB-10046 SS5]
MSAPVLFHSAQLDNFHVDPVNGLAFSQDASLLVTCGHDGYVCVFDVKLGRAVAALRLNHRARGLFVTWASSNNQFILGLSDGRVLVFGVNPFSRKLPVYLKDNLTYYINGPVVSLSYWQAHDSLLAVCHSGVCDVWTKPGTGTTPQHTANEVLNFWLVNAHAAVIAFRHRGIYAIDLADPDDLKRDQASCPIDWAAVCVSSYGTTAVEISGTTVNIFSVLIDNGPLTVAKTQTLRMPVWLKEPSVCGVATWRSLVLFVQLSGDGLRVFNLPNGQDVPDPSTSTNAIPFNGEETMAICSASDIFNVATVHVTKELVQINIWTSQKPTGKYHWCI